MGKKDQQYPTVMLPRYLVSDAEWAAVQRTVPDRLLRWGSMLPYYGLLALWMASGKATEILLALIFWGLFTVISARVSPWLALAGAVGLHLVGANESLPEGALVLASLWFLALGMTGALSGIRLALTVRGWRLHATGREQVPRALVRRTSGFRRAGFRAWEVIGFMAFLNVTMLMVEHLRDSPLDLWALPETFTSEDGELVVPLLGTAFGLFTAIVGWSVERLAGNVVLDVPVDPQIGPLHFARTLNSVENAEADRKGCCCGAKERRRAYKPPEVLPIDDSCPLHGIEAVNALDPVDFQRSAIQSWIWGANAGTLPVRSGERIGIIGLHRWGSRPAAVGAPVPGTNPEVPTHTGYSPWRVREVFTRGSRTIRWRDANDNAPIRRSARDTEGAEFPVIDHIRLDAVRLRGVAVRREGTRPRVETEPAPWVRRRVPQPAPTPASTP